MNKILSSTNPVVRKSNRRKHSRRGRGVSRSLNLEQLECRRLMALNPTADEQEFMQLVNRFRTDPKGEYARLFSSTSPLVSRDPILQVDLDFAAVNGSVLRNELNALNPVPPVAWNEAVRDYTVSHNALMIAQKQHFHSNSVARRNALIAAGVNLRIVAGEVINSENVYGYGKSTLHAYASLVIDWQQGGPNGMASGRSHRVAIHNDDFEQAGHAITNYAGTGFGPKVTSQILANIENPPVFVTGAIFRDNNGSGWYEAGEGLNSVRFSFVDQQGNRFETTGYGTGGYQIELPRGTYTATASGGGMNATQRKFNIVVGDVNSWVNWMYDPNVIPPDALESNNQTSSATTLTGQAQTLSGLSIHTAADVDYFRLSSIGSGQAIIATQFTNAAGNLDLQLLNAGGSVIASATGSGNGESLTANLVRGAVYYVKVFGKSGATNGSYSLTVNPPQATPPTANSDFASFNDSATPIVVNILANDVDPDGDRSKLVPKLAGGSSTAFTLTAQKSIQYSPPAGYSGVHRANYTIVDDQGLESASATISIFVVDFSDPTPWQNNPNGFDVNDDGSDSPLDALLVINELNQRQARSLPTNADGADQIFGFVDTSGDGFITPLDALLVINRLNGNGNGEGEGNLASTVFSRGARISSEQDFTHAHDLALAQLSAAVCYSDLEVARRRDRGDE